MNDKIHTLKQLCSHDLVPILAFLSVLFIEPVLGPSWAPWALSGSWIRVVPLWSLIPTCHMRVWPSGAAWGPEREGYDLSWAQPRALLSSTGLP